MDKRRLFGGALLAAGLTAGAAGDFVIGSQPGGNYVGAYFGGFIPFSINGFYDETAFGTGYAHAQGSALSISAYGYSVVDLAYTIHFNPIPFQVDADTLATVSWDFTGDTDGPGGAFIDSFISVDGPGGNLAFGDLFNPVGSVIINLVVGEQYSFFGTALATGGISEFSIVIPAPGGAALLGLAGFATRRRRRR